MCNGSTSSLTRSCACRAAARSDSTGASEDHGPRAVELLRDQYFPRWGLRAVCVWGVSVRGLVTNLVQGVGWELLLLG
jgi:hypothetical protein